MISRLIAFTLLASPVAASPTILVLGAVPQEIAPVVEALNDHFQESIEGIPCDTGSLGGYKVVVAVTGVGKTNSAMTTTALVIAIRPAKAFMTGTAARIRKTIRTGVIIFA